MEGALVKQFRNGVRVVVVVCMVLCAAGRTAAAQEEPPALLDEVVVTASKTEKAVDDAPGAVVVITAQEMAMRTIETVDEALASVSGAFQRRNKGLMDSTSSLYMRGFNGDQYVLVLLDGQPLNDAYAGGLEWGALPVGNIERIEVVKGAASALYGGNAMGGVVNIITKTPEKREARISAGYGSHATKRLRLHAGDRFNDVLSMRIGYEVESTDGYETTPVVRTISAGAGTVAGGYGTTDKYGNATKWVVGDRGKNGAERSSIDAKLSYDYSDRGNLAFSFVKGRHEYEYDRPNSYMGTFTGSAIAGTGFKAAFSPNNFIDYTGIGRNDTEVYTLSFKELFAEWQVDAQIGMVLTDDRYTTESGGAAAAYDDSPGSLKITETRTLFSEIRTSVPLGLSHMLTLGASYRTDTSDTDDYNVPFYRSFEGRSGSTFYSGGEDRIGAVFVQDEWHIAEPVTVFVGGRFDMWEVTDGASGVPGAETLYESTDDSQFSPKIALVWSASRDMTVRASVGHAFRPPTLLELYRTWTSWGTTYQSNPDLKPEKVWAYEIGVTQYFFNRKTRLALTGYRNDTEDLIYYQVNGATRKRMNAGEARTYGLEFEASQKLTDTVTIWGNYTFTNAKIIENPTDTVSEGKRVTGIPRTTVRIGVDAAHKWFEGSLVGRYAGKVFNDSDNGDTAEGVYSTYESYMVVDGKITFKPLEWMDLSFSVENIFDEEYYRYYKGDGRTCFVEMTLKY